MGIKRIVDVSFWTDEKTVDLFSPEDKYFMLYLLTNPHTTQLGIYKYSITMMAFELGYSKEAVSVLLDRFDKKYKLIYRSETTNELAIKNYLRYSIIKGGKPVEDLLNKEIGNVKDKSLIQKVFTKIASYKNLNETIKKIINENVNDNDNDNDNEESLPDSLYDSLDDSLDDSPKPKKTKKFIKPTIKEIKDYCIERNNNIEAERFFNHYESNGWMVGRNKMKDWKASVRTWEQKQIEFAPQQKVSNGNNNGNVFFDLLKRRNEQNDNG